MVECFEAGSNFFKCHQVEVEQSISPGPGLRTPGHMRGPSCRQALGSHPPERSRPPLSPTPTSSSPRRTAGSYEELGTKVAVPGYREWGSRRGREQDGGGGAIRWPLGEKAFAGLGLRVE